MYYMPFKSCCNYANFKLKLGTYLKLEHLYVLENIIKIEKSLLAIFDIIPCTGSSK